MQDKWKVLATVTIGSLMGAIDSTVLIIAFPQIAQELHSSLVAMVWVLLIYILIGTALVLSFGRVADMKGRKRLYLAGFTVFIVGSALCGLAQSVTQLIAFRGIQGVGGALLLSNSFAILSDAFPPNERGRAFGINSVVWGSGTVLGVIFGGLILSVTTWRWIFWINVPIGVAAVLLVVAVIRESVTQNPQDTFDFPAAALFTGALALLLLGLSEGILTGWTAPGTLAALASAFPLFVGFCFWEARVSRDPILPLGLFRNWLFSASLVALVLQGVALFSTNLLLMIYLQGIRGIPVLTAAFLLVPLSVALAVVGPLGGRWSDRHGARILSTIGLLVQGSALFLLSTITGATSLWDVALCEALLGAGGGLFYPANAAAIMGAVSRNRHGVASGVLMTVRNSSIALSFAVGLAAMTTQLPGGTAAILLGGAFGPATIAQLQLTPLQLGQQFLGGMQLAFRLSATLMAVGAVFSAIRGRENRSTQPMEAPPANATVEVRAVDAPTLSVHASATPTMGFEEKL